MRRAAERLFLTQQGVSRIIITLEKELECELFERKRTGLEPTREGRLLYDTAIRIQSEMAEFRNELGMLHNEKPSLRVACASGLMTVLLPVIRAFNELHPEVDIVWNEFDDIECERRVEALEADIGFCLSVGLDKRFISDLLVKERIKVLVREGDPLAERDRIRISDLRENRIITYGDGFHIYEYLKKRCIEEGFYPDFLTGINSLSLCYKLVSMGEGVGIAGDQISGAFAYPGVVSKVLDEDNFTLDFAMICRRAGRVKPWLEEFRTYMLEKTADMR